MIQRPHAQSAIYACQQQSLQTGAAQPTRGGRLPNLPSSLPNLSSSADTSLGASFTSSSTNLSAAGPFACFNAFVKSSSVSTCGARVNSMFRWACIKIVVLQRYSRCRVALTQWQHLLCTALHACYEGPHLRGKGGAVVVGQRFRQLDVVPYFEHVVLPWVNHLQQQHMMSARPLGIHEQAAVMTAASGVHATTFVR